MTESSYPQPGLKPGDGPDCGAYTANQWRGYNVAKMRASGMIQSSAPILPTVAQYPDVGVFYAVPNRLAVTSPAAKQITVETGTSLVDGTLHYNDTVHTAVAITPPVANPRIDVVVVRQNYGGVAFFSPNAPALFVPANTARIAVISGAENAVPVAPALTQDTTRATYWDIPLAQYQIATAPGGAITNLTDRREWVDAETKKFLVQAVDGFDVTVGAAPGWVGPRGFELVQTSNVVIGGFFTCPEDLISMTSVTAVVKAFNTGFLYICTHALYGQCGESYFAHQEYNPGPGINNRIQVAIGVAQQYYCVLPLLLASIASGDVVYLGFNRDATDALDTVADSAYCSGWIVEYLGWGRK